MSSKDNFSIEKLDKQVFKQRNFLDKLLLNNGFKEINKNWKKYILSVFFIDILKITEDLIVLLKNGSGYTDSVATRLLIERYIYCKYILKAKNQNRFNNWMLKNYKKERVMICNILGSINNKKIEEEKKFLNKKELFKYIEFLDKEIDVVGKKIVNHEEFKFSDMIAELDIKRKDKLNHYLYYVVYPFLSSNVHGSARSMESHFIKNKDEVVLTDKKDRPELLTTALYVNKEIFKTVKKFFK